MMEVEYDLAKTVLYDSPNSLERFFGLLPVEDLAHVQSPPSTPTPCGHARKLGERLGLPWLFLKHEAALPTGTTKDRMAYVSLAFLHECGVRVFCTSSTGNSSTSYAHAIAHYPDMRMYVFTAEDFQGRVDYGATDRVTSFLLRNATFVDAFDCAATFAGRHQLVSERGFFNPGRREGLKLAFLEAAEQVPRPIDWYVQAVSSAMGVHGTYKGAKELLGMRRISRLPRLLCVQQAGCSPMVTAYKSGSEVIRPEHIVHHPTGIAQAILRGDPSRVYPYVRQIVIESQGDFTAVTEAEIREARRLVEELEGLSLCFSAAAAVAGLARSAQAGTVSREETVMVNLTGSDRPPSQSSAPVHWLRASPTGWIPEDAQDSVGQALWNGTPAS